MQIARSPRSCFPPVVLQRAASGLCFSSPGCCVSEKACISDRSRPTKQASASAVQNKTESLRGELIGSEVDCDGDGINNESQIDFNGDGVSDECVRGAGEIPEPPFEQSYLPASEEFYRQLPAVGWSARYQCGDDLYEVQLSRPTADQIAYSAQGLTLTSEIVYDDIDPNLNVPLIIEEPESGIRYSFTQQEGDEFYEYAITNYSGDIGLYIYQTENRFWRLLVR